MARSATEQKNGLAAISAIVVSAMKKSLVHLIRRVDHFADAWGKGEEEDDLLPGTAPGLADCRVALRPGLSNTVSGMVAFPT
ncbi:hypothetical protein ACVJGD_005521 [Bradyrhizobium sp. USDA 10063]